MHWAPLRLVQKRWKALYVVGGFIVTAGLFRLINFIPSDVFVNVLTTIIQFAWVYYATRIFRVSEELLEVPRPWWRMTGRPKAGFLLGALWLFSAGTAVPLAVRDDSLLTYTVTSVVEYGLLAYLYFASSIRLRRLNAVATRQTGT